MATITETTRVMEHDADGHGTDIGTAAEFFGEDLVSLVVGNSLGEDAASGAYDRWPVTLDGADVAELRDDAAGLTLHVETA